MSDDIVSNSDYTGGESFFGQMIMAGVADRAFVREIVQMFIDEGQLSLDLLSKALDENNNSAIQLYAHKLKSSFLMFDMDKAHSIAVLLEQSKIDNLKLSIELFITLQSDCKDHFVRLKQKYLID